MPNSILSSSFASLLTTTTRIVQNLLTKFAVQLDFLEDLRVTLGNDLSVSIALELQSQRQNADFVSIPRIEMRSTGITTGDYTLSTNTIILNEQTTGSVTFTDADDVITITAHSACSIAEPNSPVSTSPCHPFSGALIHAC